MTRSCSEVCERSRWGPDGFQAEAAELARRIDDPAILGEIETALQGTGDAG